MATPTTLPQALTEIEELRGQVRELLRLLGQEVPRDTGAAGRSTTEVTRLNDPPKISFAPASFERQQTEHERVQTSAELRNVIETIPDIIFKLDLHGNLSGWNKRFEIVTGFVPEELSGRPALSFVPECEREQTATAILRAMEEGYAELEGHLLTKDQRAIPYHWTGAALKSNEGQVVGITGVGRDMSEKKRIEAELHRQQQSLLAAQTLAHVGSWEWDLQSGTMKWSEEQFRIFGYEPKAIPATYETFLAAVLPDDHDRVVAAISDALEGKTSLDVESRIVRPDGEIRTIHCCGEVVRAEDGSPVRLSGSALDITDRKRAESALQQSEAHFRALIENSSDIITVLALDATILFESPSFERLLGYTQHEIDGRIAFDFIHPDDLPTVLEKFQLIVQRPGETHTAEFRFRHKDGSWRQFEGVGRTTCDSQSPSCVIVNSRDITERKRAEVLLASGKQRLQDILDAMFGFVALYTLDGRIVEINQAPLEIGPVPKEDVLNRYFWETPWWSDLPEMQSRLQDWIGRAAQGEQVRGELEFRLPSGERASADTTFGPLRDASGTITHVIGFGVDITGRKQAESDWQFFKQVIAQTNDPIFWLSPADEFRFMYVNDAACAHFGYSREELLSMTIPDWDPLFPMEACQRHWAGLRAKKTDRFETIHRRKNGELVLVEVTTNYVVHAGKEYSAGTITNITDRKQAEKALRESEERYRALVDFSPNGVFVYSNGKMVYVNQAACSILGAATPEQLIEDPAVHFSHSDTDESIHASIAQILATGEPVRRVERTYQKFDGTEIVVEVDAGLITWNGEPAVQVIFADITKRKLTEEALRASEERFHAALRHASVGMGLIDLSNRIVEANQAFSDITGYTEAELKSLTFLDITHPDDRPTNRVLQQGAVMGKQESFEVEKRYIRKDGETVWVHVSVGSIHDAEGQVTHTIGLITDITERKRAEESLIRSRDLLKSFVEHTPVAVAMFDRNLRYVAVSRRWLSDYRLGEQDLIGRHHYDVFPEIRAMREWQEIHQRCLSGAVERREQDHWNRPDGTEEWVRWEVRPWQDVTGEIGGIIMFTEVITERKRAEMALGVSQEKLRQALQASNTGLWDWNTETNEVGLSPEWKHHLGYKDDELVAALETWETRLHPEDRFRTMAYVQEYLAHPEGEYQQEFRLRHKDGTYRWIEARASLVTEPDGRRVRLLGSHTDISARKRIEDALRISQDRYARATAVARVGVWELDAVQGLFNADDNLKALLGYTRDELSAAPDVWLALVHPDDQATALDAWDHISKGLVDTCSYEARMRCKDGAIIWAHIRGYANRDATGRVIRLIGATADITERKRAEAALRESEERYRTLVDLSPNGVFVYSNMKKVYVNQAACTILGATSPEQLIEDPAVHFSHPDTYEAIHASVAQLLATGTPVRRVERTYRKLDGTQIIVEVDAGRITWSGEPAIQVIFADITERKKAEEALRRSKFVIDRNADAVYWINPDARILDVNEAASLMLGYTMDELCAMTVHDLNPDFTAAIWPGFWAETRQVGSMLLETVHRTKDGRLIPIEVRVNFLAYEGKEYHCAFVRDITDRKRSELALKQAQDTLRQTQFSVDHASDGFFWIGPDARILDVNEAACRLLEYTHDELTAMTVYDIDPSFSLEGWPGRWEALKEKGSMTFESKHWSKTGRVVDAEVTVNYLHYDGKEFNCAIMRDIGERKRAEAELRQSHAFIRQVIDTDPNFIFAKDREGRFTLANRALAEAYGTTVENLIGKTDSDFNHNLKEVAFFRRKDIEAMDSLLERFIAQETITDATGQVRWLQTVKRPLVDAQGRATMVLGASTDITARKHVEMILRQRERDLRAVVAERERISEDLHDGILQSIFAVGLGLDSCKTLMSELPLPRRKTTATLMTALNSAIRQLNHVMAEVRNFIAGSESHILQGGDVALALRNLVRAMCVSNKTACRIRIEDAAARELSTEQAFHVMHIVREALSNSLRHSGAGRITLSLRQLRRSIRLSVRDNGSGFNPGSVHDVGHGLANMAARARKLGGRFDLHSRPRQGTKVRLDIPRRPADE